MTSVRILTSGDPKLAAMVERELSVQKFKTFAGVQLELSDRREQERHRASMRPTARQVRA